MVNLKQSIRYVDKQRYRHDRRADKRHYRHDCRADKRRYRHDSHADSQCRLYKPENDNLKFEEKETKPTLVVQKGLHEGLYGF